MLRPQSKPATRRWASSLRARLGWRIRRRTDLPYRYLRFGQLTLLQPDLLGKTTSPASTSEGQPLLSSTNVSFSRSQELRGREPGGLIRYLIERDMLLFHAALSLWLRSMSNVQFVAGNTCWSRVAGFVPACRKDQAPDSLSPSLLCGCGANEARLKLHEALFFRSPFRISRVASASRSACRS
jgi:hypothetical protein